MRTFGDKRKKNAPNAFIGREQQLALFRQNLENGYNNEAFINIFNIYGQGGVGKSTLARRYEDIAKEKKVLTTFIDQENNKLQTVPAFMAAVAKKFSIDGFNFDSFDKRYKIYQQEKQQIEKDIDYPTWAKTLGSSIAEFGIKAIPGGEIITDYLPKKTIVEQSGEWLEFLRKKLSNKDEIQLLLEPLHILTPLWLDGLNNLSKKSSFCIFIDTYETVLPEFDLWLRKLLNEDYGDLTEKILLVISGRNRLSSKDWSIFNEFIQFLNLKEFTEKEARVYLNKREIFNETIVNTILTLSNKLPVLLVTLADEAPTSEVDILDPSDTAVDRFLKWIKDPLKSKIALRAAIPRRLNKDIVKRLLPEEKKHMSGSLFDWLQERTFVQKRGEYWTYHPIVRDLILRYQRQISEEDWEEVHYKLADFFQERINNLELSDRNEQFNDERCVGYLLELCYHQLCAGYKKSLPSAIQGFASILGTKGMYKALPWITTIIDVEAILKIEEWGSILQKGLAQLMSEEEQGEYLLKMTQKIIDTGWLHDSYNKSIFLLIQGYAFSSLGQKEKAIKCYEKAIKENTELASPWYNMGNAYDDLGQKKKAIECYEKAISKNPELISPWYNKGKAHSAIGQKRLSIACYEKVLEIKPDYFSAYNNMGIAYSSLGQKEKAIESYKSAIDINSSLDSTWYNMGNAYDDLGQKEKAIECYEKSIEIKPDKYAAWYNIGFVYESIQQKEKALESYKNSIQIKPNFILGFEKIGKLNLSLYSFKEAEYYLLKTWELSEYKKKTIPVYLGHIALFQHNHQKAITWYQKSILLWCNTEKFYQNMQDDYQELKMKDYGISLNDYNKIINQI